jgi:hypothetical protein
LIGHPEFALLIALGALIPDLDREYWFIKVSVYRDEQLHRALLHNVFVMGLFYLVSPFLALGIFLHLLLDSFTTSKDRGCEWFWPLSRLVKRGLYNCKMEPQPLDPKERVYFYHEDVEAVIEYAEPDLPEPESPWRRIYGPALNSNLLDRGFLFGAIGITIVCILTQYFSNSILLMDNLSKCVLLLIAYFSIIALFVGGELDRRDQEAPFGKTQMDPLKKVSFLKIPLVILGGFLAILWLILFREEILANLEFISSNWLPIFIAGLILVVTSITVVKWYTRKSKIPAIV